ncbi:MAG: DUF362 domain-containing protein [Candidatus Alcyoniella australis]|nr:DUF362 domain-containing protein [Candidatus Alcyoniella australis]
MTLTRREALAGALAATAALGLSPNAALAAGPLLAKVKGNPEAATRKAVELVGGMSKFCGRGSKVVIKPNMGFAVGPAVGATTNPQVVRVLAQMALEAGAKRVLVIDNPVHQTRACLEQNQIREACADLPDTTVLTMDDKRFFVDQQVPGGQTLRKTAVFKDIVESDLLINVPTAKSHGSTTVSMSLKNLMGAIYNRRVFHAVHNLHQAIADLSSLVRPGLIVLDASRCLTDKGPGGPGTLVKARTIIAGSDPVAVDSLGVTLAPWYGKRLEPSQIKHIVRAAQLGLGEINSDRWQVRSAEV